MVCSDPESGTDHSIKEVSAYIIFGTWYKHEVSRVNATSYFFALLCIFTNNIYVIVKFSSAEGTCIIYYAIRSSKMYIHDMVEARNDIHHSTVDYS